MANTTDEVDTNESASTSESQAGMLPEEEKCSLKAIVFPQNSDPSKLSGLVVNVSCCIIGKCCDLISLTMSQLPIWGSSAEIFLTSY